MLQIILVILPVFLLIFIGQVCRRRSFPGDGFWAPAEKLTYYLLLPALIVIVLAEADFARLAVLPMALAMAGAIILMTGLVVALRPLLEIDGPGFTSVYQSVVRLNAYIGLSVAFGLYGETGLAIAAVAVATFVPLVNVTSTFMLARYGTSAQPSLGGVLKRVAANPLHGGRIAHAELSVLDHDAYGVGDVLVALGIVSRRLGHDVLGERRNLVRDAEDRQAVSAVRGDLDLQHVARGHDVHERLADGRVVAQDQDALVVVPEAELLRRAHHARRLDPADRGRGQLHGLPGLPVDQLCTDAGEGDALAGVDVRRAADDGLGARSRVDGGQPEPVRVRVR